MGRWRETLAVGLGGAALGGLTTAIVGIPLVGAAIGGLNGVISGHRQTYDWRSTRGRVAFALDSTWGLATTAAALVAHALGTIRGNPQYSAELSERQNRHVYGRGFQLRAGFATTYGNTVVGAGDVVNRGRAKLVTDHEDVHAWQSRWFGPLFPVLYGGWMAGGAIVGAAAWLVGRRRASFVATVETVAYYLNPFEYWAYSRGGNWPPTGVAAGLGPTRPAVRPLSNR